jgi:hypothetical protein
LLTDSARHEFAAVHQLLRPSVAERLPASSGRFFDMSIRNQITTMAPADGAGFARPSERYWAHERCNRALAELITTAALAVCLVIAMVAVSIGLTCADTSGPQIEIGRVL